MKTSFNFLQVSKIFVVLCTAGVYSSCNQRSATCDAYSGNPTNSTGSGNLISTPANGAAQPQSLSIQVAGSAPQGTVNRGRGSIQGSKDKMALRTVSNPNFGVRGARTEGYYFTVGEPNYELKEVQIQKIESKSYKKRNVDLKNDDGDFLSDTVSQQYTPETDPLTNAKMHVPDVASLYERYNPYQENVWVRAGKEQKSTFGIDVDNGSYTNFRRFANNNQLPPKDAIRVEEWLNFFNYKLEAPSSSDRHPLRITTESGVCPWNAKDELVMVKLQAKRPVEEDLPSSNLVFLVDVSGSMNMPDKLPLVQQSMEKLVAKMRPSDRMTIVTYAGSAGVALSPTLGTEKNKIRTAIQSLTSGGGTAGSEGIKTAYRLAEEHFMKGGNNRVILATDGDFNIGITNQQELIALIEEKRKSGVYLSVLGFGKGNLNDAMMEQLADHGNGNYGYVDCEKEADRIFDAEFAGSMFTVAKDVKLQVKFDSTVVEKYRLIGYENRVLENWQFEADSIDAGDLGLGQNVVAFYQVTRKPGQRGSIGQIDFRYKPLDSDVSTLLSEPVMLSQKDMSSDFLFASCVVEFAMCLRESEYRSDANMAKAILRGKLNLGDPSTGLSYEKRVEFVGLLEKTAKMWGDYVEEDAIQITQDHFPTLKMYPNPATDHTIVEVPQDLSEFWSVQLFSMSGELMRVEHFEKTTTGRIDLTGLTPQTYIVKVYSGGMNFGYLRLVVGF
jgi:Ca-activated chloride channel family protein